MKELMKGKAIVLFLVFMVGISCVQEEQIKMDSSSENNLLVINA